MSNRSEVLEKYPYAHARKWTAQYSKDEWTIWWKDKNHVRGLGKGYTQKEAWEDAANKLKANDNKTENNQ